MPPRIQIEPERFRAWRMLLQAHARLTRRLAAEMEEERNLPLSWYEVLLRLNQAPGRALRLQELARQAVLSQSRISRLVDEMARAGLVRKEASPTDRRGANAVLTDAGRARLRETAPTHLRGIQEHFAARLTDEEARAMADGLERVLAGLEDQQGPG